ncbi:MAG TPA: cyclopropane-fatty-acyl-phospholipid synthase family protein [Acidimicrobiales bacterium]|nr:cyclopropane-fatty-acyl-phospholipid synthase family protein [Acidimicrobiales bacterium]
MAVTRRRRASPVAAMLAPIAAAVLGAEPPVGLRCWDGSVAGPADARATLVLRSPRALRRVLYAPGELGLARAYLSQELDVEGDLLWLLQTVRPLARDARVSPQVVAAALRAVRGLGILGPPLGSLPEEARPRKRGGPGRDRRGVAHHYDVGNDFYRLVLGPSMTYSCGRFASPDDTLERAQEAKHELICNKLGLAPGMRLLDVGCGWGALVRHAAVTRGVDAVGITLSGEQRDWAIAENRRVGVADRVEIRLQHFQELAEESFDAICSVGMYEHVADGEEHGYFTTLHRLLAPGGRVLNQAISKVRGSHYRSRSFLLRYVFPNGCLRDIGTTLSAMQRAGFEVRDLECLREHYGLTLRRWVANLEGHWETVQDLVGTTRARVWRLYMVGAIDSFDSATIALHQALGVKLGTGGTSGFPLTRAGWS